MCICYKYTQYPIYSTHDYIFSTVSQLNCAHACRRPAGFSVTCKFGWWVHLSSTRLVILHNYATDYGLSRVFCYCQCQEICIATSARAPYYCMCDTTYGPGPKTKYTCQQSNRLWLEMTVAWHANWIHWQGTPRVLHYSAFIPTVNISQMWTRVCRYRNLHTSCPFWPKM